MIGGGFVLYREKKVTLSLNCDQARVGRVINPSYEFICERQNSLWPIIRHLDHNEIFRADTQVCPYPPKYS